MKKRIVVIAALIGTFISYSQTEKETIKNDSIKTIQKEVQEPEWTGQAVYLDGEKRIVLENQRAYLKTSRGIGIAAFKHKYQVKGNKSTTRIKSNNNLTFIVNFGSNTLNPNSTFKIIKLLTNKKNIRYYINSSTSMIVGKKNELFEEVSFTAKKYGKYSYQINIPNIGDGEYALVSEGTLNFNLFAIE